MVYITLFAVFYLVSIYTIYKYYSFKILKLESNHPKRINGYEIVEPWLAQGISVEKAIENINNGIPVPVQHRGAIHRIDELQEQDA
jgi:hypothetical protein